MKYSLRSLMIVVLVLPPLLAGAYSFVRFLAREEPDLLCLLVGFVLAVAIPSVVWMLIPIRP